LLGKAGKFSKADDDWFCFLWRPMADGSGDAFAIVMTEPGPDVVPSIIARSS
jgi:hypothetical protein